MAAYICFLRGVNVGGKGKVPMAELKAVLEGLGLENVKTILQSGNVVFTAKGGAVAALTRKIEAAIEKTFKYQSDVHLLTPAALRKIVDGNPYSRAAKDDPGRLLVLVVSKTPEKTAEEKLTALAKPGEKFTVTPQAVYLYHPEGAGTSKMSGGALDRALGVRGTSRNWNTIGKLLALVETL